MSGGSSGLGWELGAQERARQEQMRRQRLRVVALSLASLVSVAIIAGSAWTFWLRDDGTTLRADFLPPDITLGPRPALDLAPACRSPLTPDDPLRLWIAGDSLAGTLGPALGQLTAETGVVLPTFDYRTSSGLSSPSFFDWPERAAEEVTRVDPEIVVFIIGANDTGVVRDTPTGDDGEPAWRATYAGLVDEMLGLLTGDGRILYWVGSPTLRDDRKNRAVQQVNETAQERVADRHDETYVDAYDLFADDDGEYAATLRGIDGEDARVRTSDGIHFTPAGGELLATYVYAYLDEQCAVAAQSVPGHVQPIQRSPGSGAGTGSGDDPPSTTRPPPPPTAPPTTTTSFVPPTITIVPKLPL